MQKGWGNFFKKYRAVILTPFILLVLFLSAFVIVQQSSNRAKVFPKGVRYVSDQIIVKYKEGQSPNALNSQGKTEQKNNLSSNLSKLGITSQKTLFDLTQKTLQNYYVLSLKTGVSIPEIYEQLKKVPEIENSTPDYILKIQQTPNDPYFESQWGLKNINIESAWDKVHVNGNVTVAVVDTGVDYNHEDLRGVVIKGKNVLANNNDPMDDQGHGTHVAGIIGALSDNRIGVSGVSWGARILAVKACDKNGDCNTVDVARAITYVVDKGTKIINISIAGSGTCNGTYADTLKYAAEHGALVISAAGNGNGESTTGVNADTQIPASCENILAVGALNADGGRSQFSNYGDKVRIAAPGGQSPCSLSSCIVSTSLDNKYTLRAGTSMAAPVISGAAALLLANNPKLKAKEIEACLIRGGDELTTDFFIGPRLNVERALTLCSPPQGIKPSITPKPGAESYSISGTVFVDDNGNGQIDTNEKPYTGGAQIILSGFTSDSVVSNAKGKYVFSNLSQGLYTISATINGQAVGQLIDTTLSKNSPTAKVDLLISKGLIPIPTQPIQQTASGCYIDPACLTGEKAFQVCSFQCK